MTELLSVRLRSQVRLVPPVVRLTEALGEECGLPPVEARGLAGAVEEACVNAIQHGFDPDEPGTVEVRAVRRAGQLVFCIRNDGLPFDSGSLARGGLGSRLMQGLADEVHVRNLGPQGMQVELLKTLPFQSVDDLFGSEEPLPADPPKAPLDTPLEIRLMEPSESLQLGRLVYRTYGHTYAGSYIYFPDRVAEMLTAGQLISCIVMAPGGEMVGHTGLTRSSLEAATGEVGQAMVDPRYRGRHLFERMKAFLVQEAQRLGMLGVYSEAVTVHPFTQEGNRRLGASETGLIPAYVPGTFRFKKIPGGDGPLRQAVMLYYMRARPEDRREIHPPPAHRGILEEIVTASRLDRGFGSGAPLPGSPARVEAGLKVEWGLGSIRIRSWGEDAVSQVQMHLRDLCVKRMDTILLDLPLDDPATAVGTEAMEALGFSFAGLVPELEGSDCLRLVYLNNVPVDPDRIATASDLGRRVKDYVMGHLRHA